MQAIIECRGLDGHKVVTVANAQIKLSDNMLPQIGPLMVLEALKAKDYRCYANLWQICLQEEYRSPVSETEEFYPALDWTDKSPLSKPVTHESPPLNMPVTYESQSFGSVSQPSIPVTQESQFPVRMTQESQPPQPVTKLSQPSIPVKQESTHVIQLRMPVSQPGTKVSQPSMPEK